MATLTIRDISARVMRRLDVLAKQRNTSVEQEARRLLEEHVTEHSTVLEQIEASWSLQGRRPSAAEIDGWINSGRE